jgi:hypothetical protein
VREEIIDQAKDGKVIKIADVKKAIRSKKKTGAPVIINDPEVSAEQRKITNAGLEAEATPDWRVDLSLVRFIAELEVPPNLTRELAAEASKEIDETITALLALKAKLAAHVYEQKPSRAHPADPEALLKSWTRLAAPELKDRIHQIRTIAGTGRHLEEGVWRVVDRMKVRLAKLENGEVAS